MRILVALGTLLALSGCSPKENGTTADTSKPTTVTFDKAAAEAEIRASDSVFFSGVTNRDAKAIADGYVNDAVSMPANNPSLHGRDEILKFTEGMLKAPDLTMSGETSDIRFSDDGSMAYAMGKYFTSWTDANGKKVTEDGKYVNILRKVDGKWKIVADAFSPDGPPKM